LLLYSVVKELFPPLVRKWSSYTPNNKATQGIHNDYETRILTDIIETMPYHIQAPILPTTFLAIIAIGLFFVILFSTRRVQNGTFRLLIRILLLGVLGLLLRILYFFFFVTVDYRSVIIYFSALINELL
jgi:RsiW-degrading membrane proteinase PrsW (M82 family)